MELINKFGIFQDIKSTHVNQYTSQLCIYTLNKLFEKEIKKTILFIIDSKIKIMKMKLYR